MNVKHYGTDDGDEMCAITYRPRRGTVSDDDLQRAFAFALSKKAPPDALLLALRLFVEIEPFPLAMRRTVLSEISE